MFVKGVARVTKAAVAAKSGIRINGVASIPFGIHDLASFREWCRSDDYPERGDFCWLDGIFWADLSMEEMFTHNQVKTEYTIVLGGIVRKLKTGYLCADRMRVSHPGAKLSCEPDLMFISYESLQTGAIREISGATGGIIEYEGTPDMALEILSKSSEKKDLQLLPEQYFAAGVKEYWLVDARGEQVEFEIFKRGPKGFLATPHRKGAIRSKVFGHSFTLTRLLDRRGKAIVTLSVS